MKFEPPIEQVVGTKNASFDASMSSILLDLPGNPQMSSTASLGSAASLIDESEHVDDDAPRISVDEAISAGDALGNFLKKEAKEGEEMKAHKALVFDCGTGETKAIYFEYKVDDENKRIIEMDERNKAPATLDFLCGKNASDNEDYKAKCKQIETNKDKKGRQIFETEEEREAAREKLNDGYWFLDEKPADATDVLQPEHFIMFCTQTKDKLENEGRKPDTVMIGCSAWARDAGKMQAKADQLMVDLTKAGLLCKKLLQSQEGVFEAAAVAYAYNAMKSDGETERLPTGLIGSGGGSVQFMNNMLYPVNLDCGNRMCLEAMEEMYDDSSEEAGLASLDDCFAKSDSFKSTEDTSTTELHGRIHGEIVEERLRTEKQFSGDRRAVEAINSPNGGNIICISACYYGAMSIDKANVDDLDMAEYRCGDIISEMEAKIEEDKETLRAGKHADRKARATLFKEIANLTLQTTLFETLLEEDSMLCFKRNWELDGVPFRTTWSAGWYLNFLHSVGIHFPGSDSILEMYAETQRCARSLLAENSARLGDAANEDVAMVLVDMKTVIKGFRARALKIANPIDKFLKGIADQFEGDMVGWPVYKIKGNGSMYRKLVAIILELMEKNAEVPAYTPNIEECILRIHDSLRYTIVFPPEQYTAAVKAIEKHFLTEEGHAGKRIKFKNFWRENDGETAYQGINAQVCLRPVLDLPKDEKPVDTSEDIEEEDGYIYHIPEPTGRVIPNSNNFIFELQLHTPQSYAIKDGPGHALYEKFRDPAVRKGSVMGKEYDGTDDDAAYEEFQTQLYQANKVLYTSKDEDGNPLKEGDVVCPGADGDYTYKPFKPDPPIAFYQSGVPGANWVNALKVSSKIEKRETGLEFPFGRRIARKEAEHEVYLRELEAGKHKYVPKDEKQE